MWTGKERWKVEVQLSLQMETLCGRCRSGATFGGCQEQKVSLVTHTALNENEFINSTGFFLLQLQSQTECHVPNDQR